MSENDVIHNETVMLGRVRDAEVSLALRLEESAIEVATTQRAAQIAVANSAFRKGVMRLRRDKGLPSTSCPCRYCCEADGREQEEKANG